LSASRGTRGEALDSLLADFPPAGFAMVMATGIVSIASHRQGLPRLAYALFVLNVAAWAVLWVLNLLRAARHPRRFFGDMIVHARAPGYFTAVAATGVLGTHYLVVSDNLLIVGALWALSAALWCALTYTVFVGLTVRERKPTLERGLSGIWLLAIVATQAVAVLAAQLAAHVAQPWKLELNFVALSMWLWGGMLYMWIMTMIFYRYTFLPFSPGDLTPPYWINMGAMAISTLAGSLLVLNSSEAPFLLSLLPFLKGFTVFYWATATWWVPMLVLLGIWRYFWKRFPFQYDTSYWGAVFPLGMYAVSTQEMARALSLDFLDWIPRTFLIAALVAWALTFIGLLRRIAALGRHCLRRESRQV